MTDIEKTGAPEEELTILYEDNHIIVVLKPQNLASCPDESGDENLLDKVREYIRTAYNKPGNVYVGLVHRLDRPTGGVMVFAKTSKAAGRLGEQMKTGDFEKKYLAVLNGSPHCEQGTLVNYLKKNTVNNMVYLCTQGTDGAKLASLDYHGQEPSDPRADGGHRAPRLRRYALRRRTRAEGQARPLGVFSEFHAPRHQGADALFVRTAQERDALEPL